MQGQRSLWIGGRVLAFVANSAFAESMDPPSGKGVEELVITAERRSTDLQKTPIAATVLTGEDLIKKGVDGLTDLAYASPSVTITDYGSANVFNIRGIGRSQVDVEVPSGVVIYRDGVPTFTGYFQNEPYYDMASVEILRGPQVRSSVRAPRVALSSSVRAAPRSARSAQLSRVASGNTRNTKRTVP